jgi:hypothetical protein
MPAFAVIAGAAAPRKLSNKCDSHPSHQCPRACTDAALQSLRSDRRLAGAPRRICRSASSAGFGAALQSVRFERGFAAAILSWGEVSEGATAQPDRGNDPNAPLRG